MKRSHRKIAETKKKAASNFSATITTKCRREEEVIKNIEQTRYTKKNKWMQKLKYYNIPSFKRSLVKKYGIKNNKFLEKVIYKKI